MVLADGMVARAARFPEGFSLESTDLDHNQGKYAFRFPLGVCTIKREPHEEEKGKYLQERIDGLYEQLQLATEVNEFVGAKVYISVPPEGAVRLIATHPKLPDPMVVLLDEIERDTSPVIPSAQSSAPMPRAAVSSARETDEAAADKEA